MQKNKFLPWITAVGFAASLAVALPVFAAINTQEGGASNMHRAVAAPGVYGTVSAVNGNTLTVDAKMKPNETSTAATAYTVDASNAKIYKGSATSTVSVSSIAVGDTVMVQGTVSGSNVAATVIRDGAGEMMGRPGISGEKGLGKGTSSTIKSAPPIQGNGEPVVGGAITAISGTTLTITNTSNVAYTINAASATFIKNGTSTTISGVAVGDNVIVQGTVNGTAVTASSVIDQGVKKGNVSSTDATSSAGGDDGSHGGGFGGIFSAIGGFFQHLFGF
jgi:hypothetical protein